MEQRWLNPDERTSKWNAFEEEDLEQDRVADKLETEFNLRFENRTSTAGARDIQSQRITAETRRTRARQSKLERKMEHQRKLAGDRAKLAELRKERLEQMLRRLAKEGGRPIGDEEVRVVVSNAEGMSEGDALEYLMAKLFAGEYYAESKTGKTGGEQEDGEKMLRYLERIEEDFDLEEEEDENSVCSQKLDQVLKDLRDVEKPGKGKKKSTDKASAKTPNNPNLTTQNKKSNNIQTDKDPIDEDDLDISEEEPENETFGNSNLETNQAPTTDAHSLWFYCDICAKGIKPLKFRFECEQCPDFTICKRCKTSQKHAHKLKKFKVPAECVPPSDAEISEILGRLPVCGDCRQKLFVETGFFQKIEPATADSSDRLCEACFTHKSDQIQEQIQNEQDITETDQQNSESDPVKTAKMHNQDYLDFDPSQYTHVGLGTMTERAPNAAFDQAKNELQAILEQGPRETQLQELDATTQDQAQALLGAQYEYVDVAPQSFGLNDAELLYADETILNQMLSTKKLITYQELSLTPPERKRLNKMRNLVRKSAKINQRLVQVELELAAEESRLKKLAKRSGRGKREWEAFLTVKSRKLEREEARAQKQHERMYVLLGLKLKQQTRQWDLGEIGDVEGVTKQRLSYYNFK